MAAWPDGGGGGRAGRDEEEGPAAVLTCGGAGGDVAREQRAGEGTDALGPLILEVSRGPASLKHIRLLEPFRSSCSLTKQPYIVDEIALCYFTLHPNNTLMLLGTWSNNQPGSVILIDFFT
jgi:hypothetical protein